jgi:hypothetical protein
MIVVTLALLGLIPAFVAQRKGRSFFEWWLFGTGLFPLALPMAIMLKPQVDHGEPTSSSS